MTYFESIKKILAGLTSKEMVTLLGMLVVILGIGTAFYAFEEKWSIIDAFYFSAMTITTAGFGDLHPTTDLSKLFTVFYIFMGLGFVLAFVQTLVKGARHESLLTKVIHKLEQEQ
jgi:hypothetical protein